MENKFQSISQKKSWIICLSSGLFFFYVFFQMNIFDVINQALQREFDIHAEQLSWMSSTFIWASVIGFIPAGLMVDRYSIRKIILITLTLCIAGTLGFALTHSYVWACVFHSFTGIANAFCFLSCMVLVYQFFPPTRQALIIGCLITMAFCGGISAHTPLAYLIEHVGWRQAIKIDACVGFFILIWLYFVIEDISTKSSARPLTLIHGLETLKQIITLRQNWCAGIYTACLNLPIMVLCALWGTSYLKNVHQLSALEASSICSLIYVGSMIGGPVFGFISDQLNRRKTVMLLGSISTFILTLSLTLHVNLSVNMLACIFFMLGIFSGSQIIAYPLVSESNNPNNTGLAMSVISIIVTGGGGLGQILFGLLLHYYTNNLINSNDYQFAMHMLPIAAGISILATLGIRETYCSRMLEQPYTFRREVLDH